MSGVVQVIPILMSMIVINVCTRKSKLINIIGE